MADAEELKRSKPGSTQEETNSATSRAGLYRHPGSGAEIVTLEDPLYGDAQSEAAIRVGFERVGDAPEGYVKTIVTGDVANRTAEAVSGDNSLGNNENMKGIQARLSALESQKKDKDDEITALKAQLEARGDEAVPGDTATKLEAEAKSTQRAQSENRDPLNSGLTTDAVTTAEDLAKENPVELDGRHTQSGNPDPVTEGEENPLSEQGFEELKATATKEGVEVTPELNSKAKLREAIEAKRESENQ